MEAWHFLNMLGGVAAYEQYEAHLRIRRQRATIRRTINPFEMPRSAFVKLYRLPQPVVQNLITAIRPSVRVTDRSDAISVEIKVLAALSFYATGSYQKAIGQDYNIAQSQTMVSQSVNEVSRAINARLLNEWIRFPMARAEHTNIKARFYPATGMPGVIGCVDCTHIAIVRPIEHEETYINRKSFHSKNVQAVCDYDMRILNINAQYGGSTNDAFIWRNSQVKQELQHRFNVNRERGEWLLGDSGYANEPWMMLPILHAQPGTPEENYTNIHCHARCCVERCFGLLKSRWRCLLKHRVLHYDPLTAGQIINACAILHNMAIEPRVPPPNEPLNEADIIAEAAMEAGDLQPNPQLVDRGLLAAARDIRGQLVVRLWDRMRV